MCGHSPGLPALGGPGSWARGVSQPQLFHDSATLRWEQEEMPAQAGSAHKY